MPFDFLRKKGKEEPKPGKGTSKTDGGARPAGTPVAFDGLTEEWRLRGNMLLTTRLSDALNQREALAISDVKWAPIDGSADYSPVPGLKSVDPYDLIVVLAPEAAKSAMSDVEKNAALGGKRPIDVTLEAPPLRITGRVYLPSGMAPERLLDRTAEMFVPVVGGVAYIGDRAVSEAGVDAILVNRFYLRGVRVGADGPTITRTQASEQKASARPAPPPAPPAAAPRPAPVQSAPPAPPPAARPAPPAPPPAARPAPPPPPAPPASPEPKRREVPDWPAADRKPEPVAKPREIPDWPAADRKPEPTNAAPPATIDSATSTRDSAARPEPPQAPAPAEPDAPSSRPQPRGWPTPESGCRPKRGGLPPRD